MTEADFESVESAHTAASLSVAYPAISANLSVAGVSATLGSNEPGP